MPRGGRPRGGSEEFERTGHDPVRGEDMTALRRRLAVDLDLPFGDPYRAFLRSLLVSG